MTALNVTDLLLLDAAKNGELEVRESRGYDLDNRPEGWPVTVWKGTVCTTDDEGRIGHLQRDGLLSDPDTGLVELTGDGELALLKGLLQ